MLSENELNLQQVYGLAKFNDNAPRKKNLGEIDVYRYNKQRGILEKIMEDWTDLVSPNAVKFVMADSILQADLTFVGGKPVVDFYRSIFSYHTVLTWIYRHNLSESIRSLVNPVQKSTHPRILFDD